MVRLNTSSSGSNNINISLKNRTNALIDNNIVDKVNAMSIYNQERRACSKYRLITTIQDFCSNILYNPFTEIVKNEGSSNVQIYNTTEANADYVEEKGRMYRIDKIDKEYDYHPGADFFNNHLLRTKTFKINTNSKDKNQQATDNTLMEILTDNRGKNITTYKRKVSTTGDRRNEYKTAISIEKNSSSHLYMTDDILSMSEGDAINENLIEKNGWVGFINTSTMNVYNGFGNKILPNNVSCGFIDMYPDRTLFSFKPKYNKSKHRQENNWDICLTYPYAIHNGGQLLTCKYIDNNGNEIESSALPVLKIEKKGNVSGGTSLYFRTLFKHNLERNDSLRLFYRKKTDKDTPYLLFPEYISVLNMGDSSNDNRDFWFYVHNSSELNEWWDEVSQGGYEFMLNRMNGDMPSEYYVRIFKKIPNKGNPNFNKEIYPLSFATNIYGDNITQQMFLDDINLEGLLDHRGRPVSEIFVTIIKTNKGGDVWYDKENWSKNENVWTLNGSDTDDIEYSHCFGNVMSGLDCGDDISLRGVKNCDIHLLNNLGCYKNNLSFNNLILNNNKEKENITIEGFSCHTMRNNDNINKFIDSQNLEEGMFWGDIVEYNPYSVEERVVAKVLHRFNTYQREMSEDFFGNFKMIDIITDDYDVDKFKIQYTESSEYTLNDAKLKSWQKPEGYFYNPHYRIQIKEWGDIIQDSHRSIMITEAKTIYGLEIQNKKVSQLSLFANNNKNDYIILSDDFYTVDENFTIDYDIVKSITLWDSEIYNTTSIPEGDGIQTMLTEIDEEDGESYPKTDDEGNILYKYTINGEEITDIYPNLATAIQNSTLKKDTFFFENDVLYQVIQDKVLPIRPIQLISALKNKYIEIQCSLKHLSSKGDTILLYNTETDEWYQSNVVSVLSPYKIIISALFINEQMILTDVVDKINEGIISVRRINADIPSYAQKVEGGQFAWRVLSSENSENEDEQFIFTNGCLYIEQNINFYLRRQDPLGKYGVFTGDIVEAYPQDMKGNTKSYVNQEYKDETYLSC